MTENIPTITHDFEEALTWVWAALHDYRENSIPEHDPMYDDQWDDICTGMAWIREGLGLVDLIEKESAAPPTKTPIDYVCEDCGGSEVSVEAMVEYSPYLQRYDVLDICDKGHWCSECNGQCHLKEVDFHGQLDPAIAGDFATPASVRPLARGS